MRVSDSVPSESASPAPSVTAAVPVPAAPTPGCRDERRGGERVGRAVSESKWTWLCRTGVGGPSRLARAGVRLMVVVHSVLFVLCVGALPALLFSRVIPEGLRVSKTAAEAPIIVADCIAIAVLALLPRAARAVGRRCSGQATPDGEGNPNGRR